jgi:hypothetical protein
MENLLAHALRIVYTLLALMPSPCPYQRDSFQTLLGLFLEAPWNFRVYRGKGTPSPTQLGLRLLRSLPKSLTRHFQVLVLADTAFGTIAFIEGVRELQFHAITGIRRDRKLADGRSVTHRN